MQQTKIYKCEITGDKNIILYQINNNKAIMVFIAIDFNEPKFFLQLLRTSITDITKSNVLHIQQYIHVKEWTYFENKRTSWKIINKQTDEYLIECPIEDALENIGIGLGVDKNIQT